MIAISNLWQWFFLCTLMDFFEMRFTVEGVTVIKWSAHWIHVAIQAVIVQVQVLDISFCLIHSFSHFFGFGLFYSLCRCLGRLLLQVLILIKTRIDLVFNRHWNWFSIELTSVNLRFFSFSCWKCWKFSWISFSSLSLKLWISSLPPRLLCSVNYAK